MKKPIIRKLRCAVYTRKSSEEGLEQKFNTRSMHNARPARPISRVRNPKAGCWCPFNTTTSMGRLTLNILLSFAQFEREVIGERIRDKFAASHKRGMWMGGFVPLGYDVKDRKLLANKAEAKKVRMIFERFVKLGSATTLVRALRAEGVRGKQGKLVDKGYIYKLLNNRTYIGEAMHKGVSYPGEYQAIIDRVLWDRVHTVLREARESALPTRGLRRRRCSRA
jgi:hypothetical protein